MQRQEPNTQTVADLIETGNTLLLQGDSQRALWHYNEAKKAADSDTLNAAFYVNRGIANARCGHQSAALKDLDQAIEIDPNCASAYHKRGLLFAKGNTKGKAANDFLKAIDLDKSNPGPYVNLCSLYLNSDSATAVDDAILIANRLITANPNQYEGYTLLADVCRRAYYETERLTLFRTHGPNSSLRLLGLVLLNYLRASQKGFHGNNHRVDDILMKHPKRAILHAIKTLKNDEDKIWMLHQAKDRHTLLGQRFWEVEGILDCSLSRGTLKEIVDELARLKLAVKTKGTPAPRSIHAELYGL